MIRLVIKCKSIWITNSVCILVDLDDYEKICLYHWRVSNFGKWRYAVRDVKNSTVYMHRYLLNCTSKDLYVDHINGDGLDNRKSNVRVGSNSQNQFNVGKKSNSGQAHKNIRLTPSGTFQIRLRTDLGRVTKTVKTEQEAIILYNQMVIKYHKEFARLI